MIAISAISSWLLMIILQFSPLPLNKVQSFEVTSYNKGEKIVYEINYMPEKLKNHFRIKVKILEFPENEGNAPPQMEGVVFNYQGQLILESLTLESEDFMELAEIPAPFALPRALESQELFLLPSDEYKLSLEKVKKEQATFTMGMAERRFYHHPEMKVEITVNLSSDRIEKIFFDLDELPEALKNWEISR